jgi:uncharacterized cupredoxin-like copper-binding protein
MTDRRIGLLAAVLIASGVLLIGTASILGAHPGIPGSAPTWGAAPGGMMGSGFGPDGMMGGARTGTASLGPGEAGFVAGTPAAPRVVRILALPDLRFTPDTVRVQAGETITFEVATVGPVTHEFMVGPAPDVAADKEGTPEVADIGMMQTRTLTYTFSGPGPFAFACHAPGHYEAGMTGTIVVVG